MGTFEKLKIKDYKATGYALLIAGLILIIWAVYSMYNVYTGATPPPSVIEMNSVTLSLPTGANTPQAQAELISGRDSSKLVNMGIWYALMFFVASAGGRIGGMGVKLIREIKVEVKKED
ncbi:MAG: hypothetical protein ABOK23_09280 [Candidatus Methanoperedens sp.]|nr:hypothetical protein [Candidatus Methanoperedens sp.]MCZ7394320.1 hypothetical protein [Candidatus Methanoperedens sp.]